MDSTNRMNGGELRMARESLGLTREEFGIALTKNGQSVREDTVRKWESGKDPIPYRLRDETAALEAQTADAIGQVVSALKDMRDPAVPVYRSDAGFHEAQPQLAHFTARWWRHVVARACIEVPGVEILDQP